MFGQVRRRILVIAGLFGLLVAPAFGQAPASPRTLEIRDLTWMEVKAAIDAGYTAAIVPTGGIEQNGPHMALAKHDHIVGHAARKIAGEVGRMLVAPTISLVPEGDFSPPTGNLRWPGTIGVSDAAFEGVIEGAARSLKQAGFTTIFLIGDHGQSQAPQTRVAERLSAQWAREGVRVVQVIEYYDDEAQNKLLAARGESPKTIGEHAGMIDTSELLAINPGAVRLDALKTLPRPLPELGASGTPEKSTAALGEELIAIRIAQAAKRIRSVLNR